MLSVIIADDERKICQLLRMLVNWEELGFEIAAEEHDGDSLLKAVYEIQPDVVVTDIQMPGMSGLELLHAIREQQLDIDIIIMSGYREFDYVRDSLRDGASDYLLKPLGREAVREALLKIKGRRESAVKNREYVENIQKTLESYSKKLHKDLIRDILEGRLKQAEEAELNQRYGCGFQNAELYFITIKSDLMELLNKKTDEVVRQKVGDIIQEEMKRRGILYFHGSWQNFEYVLMDVRRKTDIEDGLYHLIYVLRDYFCKWDTGHVTIGLAPVEQGRLHEAMCKSRAAVLDQVFRGVDKVLSYREPQPARAAPVIADQKTAGELQSALIIPSAQKLQTIASERLERVWEYGVAAQAGEAVYAGCHELQRQLSEVCRRLYEDGAVEETLSKWQIRLEHCYDWNSYKRLFESQIGELTRAIVSAQQQKEKWPVRRMRQIMQERYREPLTLDSIAGELGLSAAYVSKLFKKVMGENFSQYLNTLRLNEAKRLLASTNDSAAQIADAIGYNDEKYFLRIFKKEVGLTTSEYRRLHGE